MIEFCFPLGPGSSGNPCNDVFRGTAAFSAPEVSALANYIKQNHGQIFCFLDIHSYSQLMMYPWSYSKTVTAEDSQELVSYNITSLQIRI